MSLSRVEILRRRTRVRLLGYGSLVQRAQRSPGKLADEHAAFVTIESLNLWAEFAREYFRCALHHDVTRGGHVLSTRFPRGTPMDAALKQIPAALRRTPGGILTRLHEPAWHARKHFLKTMRLAKLSLLAQVEGALAMPTRFTEHLQILRNFYSHRNEETARKVRSLGPTYAMLRFTHPTDFVLGVEPGRPVSVLEDWLAEMELVVDAMCA